MYFMRIFQIRILEIENCNGNDYQLYYLETLQRFKLTYFNMEIPISEAIKRVYIVSIYTPCQGHPQNTRLTIGL